MTEFFGLTESEAIARRQAGLGNNVALETSRSYTHIIRENLFTFINAVFFTISLLLVFLGRIGDALLVGVVILGGVIVNVFQEVWAKQKLDEIALLTRPKATVVREGKENNIDPSEIVVGDILLLQAGDQIVVDGMVVGEGRIDADESLLTGESDPVPKFKGDRVYSGSICLSGQTYYEAQKVGADSLAYKLTVGARSFRQVYTPLQLEINLVIRIFLLLATFLCILVGISVLTGFISFADGVQRAAVIAGLVPSGLYLSITLAYALGAVRMVGQSVLIQQANAVESLSNVQVLCLDKTGTLTTNRIELNGIEPLALNPGEIRKILGDLVLNSSSQNATSAAIAAVCPGTHRTIVEEVPFSSVRKWSAVSFTEGIYLLGAPEILASHTPLTSEVTEQIKELTQQGLRVLLLAHFPEVISLYNQENIPELPAPLKPLALISLKDELRPEATTTLAGFKEAGIAIKIISGDNPDTVAALAQQVGLGDVGVISGSQLETMTETQRQQAVIDYTIFGRVTPEQKSQIVRSLRALGYYVGAIGDGVNDVLFLKQANLGIAMESGSKATRNAADIVLLKDSFGALPHTFLEGQRIRNGIQDVLKLFMVRVFSVTLIILSAGQVLGTFPLLNKHSAVVTILAVGLPTMSIPLWAKPGTFPKGSVMRSLLHFTLPATLSLTLVSLVVYLGYLVQSLWEATAHGRATLDNELLATPRSALVTVLVLCGLLLVPFLKPPTRFWEGGEPRCGDWRYSLIAFALIGLYFAMLALPVVRDFFELSLLPRTHYVFICLIVLLWCLVLRWIWRIRLLDRFLGVDLH